jgi:hypothetical protein
MRDDEPLASIDDLLTFPGTDDTQPVGGQPAVTGDGNGPVARVAAALFWAALFAGLCAGAAYIVLLGLGYDISFALLFCAFLALVSLRRALRRIVPTKLVVGAPPAVQDAVAPTGPPVRPAAPGEPPPDEPAPPVGVAADGLQLALSRWQSRLSWSQKEPDRFASTVRPRFADIADERLRQRHGITRTGDPRRARELMGERLWAFLYAPPARPPNPRELAAVVEDMERL